MEVGGWLRPIGSHPALQNQEYEHPRDLAACCGSCRNVSCLFTFPNGTTSLFLVCHPLTAYWEGVPRGDSWDRATGYKWGSGQCQVLGCTCL